MTDAILMLFDLKIANDEIIYYYLSNGLVNIETELSVFNYEFNLKKHTYQFILFARKTVVDYNETYLEEIRHEIQNDYKSIKRKEVIKKLLDE